ncbi:MAG: hypothetical protein KGM99_15945 [Burkholderiales bacterium]|nr:hypothetical protein [Burkholderiales bacterium]
MNYKNLIIKERTQNGSGDAEAPCHMKSIAFVSMLCRINFAKMLSNIVIIYEESSRRFASDRIR